MTSQNLNGFNVLLSICIGLILVSPGFAQETFFFDNSFFEITASETQIEELRSLEDRMGEESETPLEKIESARKQLRELVTERNKKLEEILNADQLKSFNSQRQTESKEVAKRNGEHAIALSKFFNSGVATNDLVLFEGLPRAPEEELEKIIAKAGTFKVDQWAFYKNPLTRTPLESETLRSKLVDFHTFEPYVAGALCGGFHPDLCIHWTNDKKEYRLLICLGCYEVLFISPTGKFQFSFNQETWESFADIDGFAGQTRGEFLKQRMQGGGMF